MNATTYPTPMSTVDVVLFTLKPNGLHVLLIPRPSSKSEPFPGLLALPGGFVHAQEDRNLDDTARRVLAQKAGVSERIYLEQLQTFSGMTRDPRGWSISQAYCALVPSDLAEHTSPLSKWVSVDEALGVGLAFDHAQILQKALERVRNKTNYSLLPAYFLPDLFTLGELQKVYEVVLGSPLDKSSFRKKIDSLDAFSSVEGERREGRQRPAQLYRLKSSVALPTFRSNFQA
jgi:8-oxo-dGTP diphosphatase